MQRKGDEHPRLSAEWLINSVTNLSRVEIYMHFDQPLTAHELDLMHKAVERRASGEPLQYITGEMPFRHIVLRCEKGVLIPRPETEVLVDEVLAALDEKTDGSQPDAAAEKPDGPQSDSPQSAGSHPLVLEVGTGTGCIALSIAHEHPQAQVVATDISPRAIALATRNRDALSLQDRVDLCQTDLAADVDPTLMGTFDVLVSNPPYIPTKVLHDDIPAEVRDFEPELALDGGADGLDVFRRLLKLAAKALASTGVLCVELHETTLQQAAQLASEQQIYQDIRIIEDYTHRPRILFCKRGPQLNVQGATKSSQPTHPAQP